MYVSYCTVIMATVIVCNHFKRLDHDIWGIFHKVKLLNMKDSSCKKPTHFLSKELHWKIALSMYWQAGCSSLKEIGKPVVNCTKK